MDNDEPTRFQLSSGVVTAVIHGVGVVVYIAILAQRVTVLEAGYEKLSEEEIIWNKNVYVSETLKEDFQEMKDDIKEMKELLQHANWNRANGSS